MKTGTIKALFALGGAIVGAAGGSVATYFIMKAKCEEYITEGINEYIMAMQEEESDDFESAVNPSEDEEDPEEGDEAEEAPKPKSKSATLIDRMKASAIKYKDHDYTEHYKKSPTYKDKTPTEMAAEYEHPEDEDPDEVLNAVERKLDELPDPFIIPAGEMGSTGNDMIELVYYLGDGSLVEDDEEVFNVDQLLGECLDGYLANLPDADLVEGSVPSLYVRNEIMVTDYEVSFTPESYIH